MTPVEILAVIFSVLILIKILAYMINPKSGLKIAETVLEGTAVLRLIYLALAIVIGYYLILELNIIQISAVMFLTVVLIALALIPYHDHLLEIRRDFARGSRKKMLKKNLLYILIWAAIAVWALIAVLT